MKNIIKEINAKTILSHKKNIDPWFGFKYTMNIYRGCQHQCIYCDSRSECYHIDNFDDVLVKVNAVDLLDRELGSKRVKGTVGTGAMSDPYTFAEADHNLTGQALEIIKKHGFPVHIITKSDMVLKDIGTLCEINKVYAAVSFTITTADDSLARKVEPGAPLPSARYQAMNMLSDAGIYTGVTMMPILPFIEDNEDNIREIVEKAVAYGAKYILPWFGMTLRDRQRAFYYQKLDVHFPGMRRQYIQKYGGKYECNINNANYLGQLFNELCAKHHIQTRISHYVPPKGNQMSLFDISQKR